MRRTPLHRRTPLRRVSLKRQRVMQQRRMFVADQLARRPDCEAGPLIRTGNEAVAGYGATTPCRRRAVDIHEPLTRARGGSILDPANTVAVCRTCHDWIHTHPESATRLGLLASNRPETTGG